MQLKENPYAYQTFRLDGIKLISLSEDTLNDHVPVDSSSVENEEMSLDENEDANYVSHV